MSVQSSGSCRRFRAVLAGALVLGCEGASSDRGGDRPIAPCASATGASSSTLLLRGRVTALERGCVTLAVDALLGGAASVLSADGTVLLGPDLGAGDVIVSRLGQVYSYAHEFQVADEVAILAGTWGEALSFELMPWLDGSVHIQWAGREFDATPSDLLALDCADRLQSLADEDGTDVASRASGSETVETSAPAPSCAAP